ncbi:MAG TPA: ATP-binding protein [Nodosilinea sp.]|nr:ATP-binding protein [Nodosilinea sp.]
MNRWPRRLSWRLRLALWSAALAGGALLGFALLSSWLIYQAKLDRFDARLERVTPQDWGRGNRSASVLGGGLEGSLAQALELPVAAVALAVIDRNGDMLYRSPHWPGDARQLPPLAWPVSPPPSSPGRSRRGPSRLVTWPTPTGRWRVAVQSGPVGQVVIAANLAALQQEMAVLRRIYLLTIPGVLLAIGGGAWGLAGQALRPVRQLSQSIDRVSARGLDQRLPAAVDAEFAPLITAFNAMLERLERSFHQASRFSGDAAHELKTPLTILQGELERAIQRVEPGSATQQTLGQLLDQVRHLSGIVRKLLLLSLADAGQMSIQRLPVDLSALVQEQLEDLPLLAPTLTLAAELEPGLTVAGDRALLVQVVQNLITNAAKYNQPQGWVRVEVKGQPSLVRVTVTNATQGLTAADRGRVFERFYRGQGCDRTQVEGLGLGLSLAREIARAHGGDLVLSPSAPTEARFELHLPRADPTPGNLAESGQKH